MFDPGLMDEGDKEKALDAADSRETPEGNKQPNANKNGKEMVVDQGSSWQTLFSHATIDDHVGFVSSATELEALKWTYEVSTGSHFVAAKTSATLGNTDINRKKHWVLWREQHKDPCLPDHPYIVLSAARYECHHGPDRNRSKKQKACQKEEDHTYEKKRECLQATKKMNCPAVISAKEILMFPDYLGSELSKWKRDTISKTIRAALAGDDKSLKVERRIYVKLPLCTEHQYHLQGLAEEVSLPVDKQVTAKIAEYVAEGFHSTPIVKSLIETYVRKELFDGKKCPSWTNRRFFPNARDINNIIYAEKSRALKSKFDQENLMANLAEWKVESPEDSFHFVPLLPDTPDVAFQFVYQSAWQKKLLSRYGGELCLLDATYRTTKYSLPLFFLCVKTNVDYAVVAVFATQFEDSQNIGSALRKISEWNPDWKPQYFMVDHCEAEMNAIEGSFPDCSIFICDFHREQAWQRWLKASKHGVSDSHDAILSMLRAIANATSIPDYDLAVNNLLNSRYWQHNQGFRDWFYTTWMKHVKKWARIERQDRLNLKVNTNNGVERQNRTFKYEFLARFTDRTLTGMLTTVIKRYLPEMFRRYVQSNLKASSYYRAYTDSIPDFLKNRPKDFIEHCRRRLVLEDDLGPMVKTGASSYQVASFNDSSKSYALFLGTETELPSCQCPDWERTHWPCKHLLALLLYHPDCSWSDLPLHYRDNPLFTLDDTCLYEIGWTMTNKVEVSADIVKSLDDVSSSPDCNSTPDCNSDKQTAKATICRDNNSIKDLQINLRDELEKIKALSYLLEEEETLSQCVAIARTLGETVYEATKQNNLMPQLEVKPTVSSTHNIPFGITKVQRSRKAHASSKKPDVKTFQELPVRQKRKGKRKQSVSTDHDDTLMNLITAQGLEEVEPAKVHSEMLQQEDHYPPEKRLRSCLQDKNEGNSSADCIAKEKKSVSFTIEVDRNQESPLSVKKIDISNPGKHETSVQMSNPGPSVTRSQSVVKQKVASKKGKKRPISSGKRTLREVWENLEKKNAVPKLPGTNETLDQGIMAFLRDTPATTITVLFKHIWNGVSLPKPKTPRNCAALAAEHPVYSLVKEHMCSNEVLLEQVFRHVVDVTKNEGDNLSRKVDVCQVLSAVLATAFIHNADVKALLETLLHVPKQELFKDSNINIDDMESVEGNGNLQSLRVGNTCVTHHDMSTLEGNTWLNDKVIHGYLNVLAREANMKDLHKVYVLPCYIVFGWQRGQYKDWLFEKVNFSAYTWILVPVCMNENHWVLLAANIRKREVGVMNSLSGYTLAERKYCSDWINYTNARAEKVQGTPTGWTHTSYKTTQQNDGSSCGVFVLMYAEQLLNGAPLCLLRQCHVKKYRQFIRARLVKTSRRSDGELCDLPCCLEPKMPKKGKLSWIQCEKCVRWVHCKCAHVSPKIQTFVCILCLALGY